MSKCITQDYRCRGCPVKEACNIERVMIDSSILLSIIKHEDAQLISEEKLNQIKKDGQGFITHIILAEVYEKTINFIEEELSRLDEEFNISDYATPWKLKSVLEIIEVLKCTLERLKVVEVDKESWGYIQKLFSLPRMDMKNRDIINLGAAESYLHKKFLFIDRGIKSAEKSIKDAGFKIELEHLRLVK